MKGIIFLIVVLGAALASPLRMNPMAEFELKAEMNFDDVMNLVDGLLTSLDVSHDVNNLHVCILAVPEVIKKIKLWIEDMKKLSWKDLEKVFDMFIELFDALKEFFVGLKPCAKVPTEMEALIKKISNIDLDKMLARILLNAMDVFEWITTAIQAAKEGNFKDVGEYIGKIVYMILLDDSVSADTNAFLLFMEGFLEGLNVKGDIKKILECIKGGEGVLEKVIAALKYLIHIDIQHISDIIKGITMLIEAVKEISTILTPCGESVSEIKKLIEAIINVNIMKVVWKIISNAGEFIHDITDAINAFGTGDYKTAGKDIGDILFKLFLANVEDSSSIVEFMKGFLEGINEKGSIEELMKCIKDIEPIITKIFQAIELISHFTFQDIISGVTMLIAAVKELMNAVQPCLNGFEQLKKLFEKVMNADIMHIALKIISNPTPYIKDITECIEAIKAANFNLAGKDVGNFLYLIFLDESLELGFNFTNFVDVIKGFMKAIDQLHNFENLEKCLEAAPQIFQAIAEVIEVLKHIDWRHLDKLIEVLLKLFDAFKDVLKAVIPCSRTPSEIEEIIKKVKEMTMEELHKRIMGNMIQIVADVMEAVRHLTKGDYFSFGQDMGDTFFMLFLKK